MIGIQVQLELVDGTKHELDITWGIAYRWQLSHPDSSISETLEKGRLDHIMDLAWEAARTNNLNPKPVHQWVDEVVEVRITTPKAEPTT